MLYVGQAPMNREESLSNLNELFDHYQADDGFRVWGAFDKETHELTGTTALITEDGKHEIGFRLCERFWGKGLGTEMAQATLKYGFEKLQFDEIWAEVDQRNSGSVKILDKTMKRQKAFFNEESQTDDFYYTLKHEKI